MKRRYHKRRRRRKLRRLTAWTGLAFAVLFGAGYGVQAVLGDRSESAQDNRTAITDAGSDRLYHGMEDDGVSSGSDHSRFSLDEFMAPREETGTGTAAFGGSYTTVNVTGAWEASIPPQGVAGHMTEKGCPYTLSSLNLTLRESDGEVFGYGDYGLSSDDCPAGVTALSAYAVATGELNPPFVKLTIQDSEGGRALFTFYGTAVEEGILGQVRTPDGQLLLEHVVLAAPSK